MGHILLILVLTFLFAGGGYYGYRSGYYGGRGYGGHPDPAHCHPRAIPVVWWKFSRPDVPLIGVVRPRSGGFRTPDPHPARVLATAYSDTHCPHSA